MKVTQVTVSSRPFPPPFSFAQALVNRNNTRTLMGRFICLVATEIRHKGSSYTRSLACEGGDGLQRSDTLEKVC